MHLSKRKKREMPLPVRRSNYPASRWDPFAALDDLHDEMSRLLTNVFPDFGRIRVNAWLPPIDVDETDDAYLVEADMPGVNADDINAEIQGNQLRITGRVDETPEGRRSRRAGQFDYRVTLPGGVDTEGAQAELISGVLKLRLPKTAVATRQ